MIDKDTGISMRFIQLFDATINQHPTYFDAFLLEYICRHVRPRANCMSRICRGLHRLEREGMTRGSIEVVP